MPAGLQFRLSINQRQNAVDASSFANGSKKYQQISALHGELFLYVYYLLIPNLSNKKNNSLSLFAEIARHFPFSDKLLETDAMGALLIYVLHMYYT